jgi:hypothetical protein
MKHIYVLVNLDLTGLCGPMNSGTISTRWTKYFDSVAKAKKYAEKNYRQSTPNPEKIDWNGPENGCWTTQDLRFVQYEIQKEKVL